MRAAITAALLVGGLGCAPRVAPARALDASGLLEPVDRPAPFRGDELRYGRMDVPQRYLHDVVAIPAGVFAWRGSDWVQFALWSGAIGALMLPAPRSADARLDAWFQRELSPHLPTVWTDPMQVTLWGGIAAGGLGAWWWAANTDRPYVAEGLSLMFEALAVAQTYHASTKLLLGREGPRADGAEPEIQGPGVGFAQYPSGAPSGHATTLYSLLSAGFAYFAPPLWLQVSGHVVVAGLVTFHAIDRRHYASDLVWGGAMGWYVGQWVVEHRASRPGSVPRPAGPDVQVVILPLPLAGGGGAAVAGTLP